VLNETIIIIIQSQFTNLDGRGTDIAARPCSYLIVISDPTEAGET